MFESFKGRTVAPGQRVFVYRNLHRDMWSLKAEDGENKGKVLGHATEVALAGATFTVSEAGRQRVLREKRKNVHAGVIGAYVAEQRVVGPRATRVRYNPYEAATFTVGYAGHPVLTAPMVDLDSKGKVYI